MSRKPNPRVIYEADDSSEWHTPEWIRSLAHDILGDIDLDPATDARNQLRAARTFTLERSGLTHDWAPHNGQPGPVWMNPPFGREIRLWTALFQLHVGFWPISGIVLVPARVGARWYRELTTSAQCVCELDGRVVFEGPDGKPRRGKDGRPQPARWGVVLSYYGTDRARARRFLQRRGATRFERALPRGATAVQTQLVLERRGQLRLVE